MRIDTLNKLAELNFCENCYEKYTQLIEPSIQKLMASPLAGWPETETYLTAIIWKDSGAYDLGTTVLVDFDFQEIDDLPSEKVNKTLLLEIKKWPFSKKLAYLKKRKITTQNIHKLFDEARQTRNMIHKFNYEFSEDDLELLRVTSNVAAQIQSVYCFKNLEPIKQRTMESLEESSKLILKKRKSKK